MRSQRQTRDRGSALVEFALCSLVWLPILMGTWLFGTTLIQAIQVAQLSRDSGHMFARGVDFTNTQNTALLSRLSSVLRNSAGNYVGAIVLSEVKYVTTDDCTAANLKVCPNANNYVFIKLFYFGSSSYAQTKLGNPGLNWLKAGSSIQPTQYLSDPSLRAPNVTQYFPVSSPTTAISPAYASEVTLQSQNIGWTEFNNTQSYARTFF